MLTSSNNMLNLVLDYKLQKLLRQSTFLVGKLLSAVLQVLISIFMVGNVLVNSFLYVSYQNLDLCKFIA